MCSSDVVRLALAGVEAPSGSVPDPDASPSPAPIRPGLLAGARRIVDLTHTLSPAFPVFPGYRPFAARALATVEEDGYAAHELCYGEHTGTHLDAPGHFFTEGATADLLPVDGFVAPLVVVSIAERAARDHDATLTVADLEGWERRYGRIPERAVVGLHSGWEERLAEPAGYLNRDSAGVLHSPGFGREAAEFLVAERGVAGAATDTLSLDIGASATYDAHRVLLGAGCYGLENVAHLGRVPPAGAVLIVGAPKHAGATGGPARLLALF